VPTDHGAYTHRTIEWQVNDGEASNNLSAVSTTTITIKNYIGIQDWNINSH